MKSASIRIPLLFAAVTVLAYGLLLPFTGFYWDDWPFAWLARFLGPVEFIPAFRGFRPFLGPIFTVTTALIPTVPLLWQLFALLIRFLSGLAAWFALGQVWPACKRQVLVVSLLFLVYPGYSQHWVALTHINQEWIPLIFYLLSFAFTAIAVRSVILRRRSSGGALASGIDTKATTGSRLEFPPLNAGSDQSRESPVTGIRGRWMPQAAGGGRSEPSGDGEQSPPSPLMHRPLVASVIAVVFLLLGLFPTEYFIGLEPLRFLFIWVIVSEATHGFWPRLLQALKHWWPYLLTWLANAAWLVYYYKSGAYVSYDVTAVQGAPHLTQALSVFVDAFWKAGLYVWAQVLVLIVRSGLTPTNLLTLVLVLILFLLSSFFFTRLYPSRDDSRSFALSALLIGFLGILLGRLPSFAAGLPLTLQSSFDRFMISMMLSAALFAVGLIELLIPGARLKSYLFALLIALGVGQQFFNANIFRRDWVRQQQIYWQMAWRMPALKPGTALITQQMPLDYETDFSMTAALNWMYAPQPHPTSLPYALVYSEKRLGGVVLPSLQPDTAMHLPFRTVDFNGSTSQAVAIYVPPNGCLRVLDPALGDAETYSKFPESLTAPIAISDPSRILIDAPALKLPVSPFGNEPDHAWCYLYEQAELARQAKDWPKIVSLAGIANASSYTPQDAFEWLPFIEAYARTGDLVRAQDLTRSTWDQEPRLHRGLCVLWNRLRTSGPPGAQEFAIRIIDQYRCGQ